MMTTEPQQDRRENDEKGIIKYTVVNPRGEEQQITLTTAIVRKFFCPDADDMIANTFMGYCRSQSLDPFAKDIYLSVRRDRDGMLRPQMTTAYQSFMKIAEASDHYKGFRAGTILIKGPDAVVDIEGEPDIVPKPLIACPGEYVPSGYTIDGGWCKVFRSDRPDMPIISTINLKDYIQLKQDGKPVSIWRDKTATMIRKTGIAHCFRDAFPGRVGKLYITEEMPTVVAEKKTAEAPPDDAPKILVPPDLRESFERLGWNQTQREMFVALHRGDTINNMLEELATEKPIITATVKAIVVSDAPVAPATGIPSAEGGVSAPASDNEKVAVQPPDPSGTAIIPDNSDEMLDF